ncbi:MAG: hypothetical protein ACXWX8_09610 [Candidatus Binatia bacterium]
MNLINRWIASLTLAMALALSTGCMENIALIGRPTLQLDQEEIFAEIARVDTASRQLHLRPEDSHDRVVGYSVDARVLYRGREYSIAQLASGDKVSMQLKQDSRGNSYTDLIRVQETIQDRNQSRRGEDGPESRIQTLDGRVEQLDFQRRTFEIRDQSREPVIVSLPSDAKRPDVDRFRELRDGDYVRVEGRFLDRQRFELATFLRDNR